MTTLELIEQKMEVALQAINAILPEGYFIGQALSSTDFGNSGYIIIKKECPVEYLINVCKVRISDHSATNSVRQATEIMVDLVRFNLDELILRVEIDSATQAITFASDIFSAQAALDRATFITNNQSFFF